MGNKCCTPEYDEYKESGKSIKKNADKMKALPGVMDLDRKDSDENNEQDDKNDDDDQGET